MSPGTVHLPPTDASRSTESTPSRHRRSNPAATALAVVMMAVLPMVLSGCSGRPAFLSGGPTVGQLKTSVAHLEYENAQMKRDLAKLRRENRQVEDRLVQQEQDNGELTARLDDARNLLRERGLESDSRTAANRGGARDSSEEADGFRTLPAGQSSRKRRKPPVARIPGQFSPAAPEKSWDEDVDGEEGTLGPPQGSKAPAPDGDQVGLRFEDLDHHSVYRGPLKWAPIAGSARDRSSRVR